MLILFSVVPITGLLISGGSVKHTWRYTKDWLRVIAILVGIALVFSLIFI